MHQTRRDNALQLALCLIKPEFYTPASSTSSRNFPYMSSYRDKLVAAKRQQSKHLQKSTASSSQLVKAVEAIIHANSINDSVSCPPLLDKITTIHDLDREIDRQLNEDILGNCGELRLAKKSLQRFMKRTRRSLYVDSDATESCVDTLQRQVELVDQNIRILEETLKLVKNS